MRITLISQVAVTVTWLFTSVAAVANDCSIVEPWITQGHVMPGAGSTAKERVAQSHLEYDLRVQTSNLLAQLYRSGKLDRTQLEACLTPLNDRQNFLETFYYTLFKSSLEKLQASRSPTIEAFSLLFQAKYGSGIPIFRVTGTFKEADDTPLNAGFHRATGSIYMDFALIHPDDWLIIFVHETLHALDDQIWVGVEGYSHPGLAKHFVELADHEKSFSNLPTEEKTSLRSWLTSGMDRGLLAEYRAWTATFQIYREGVGEGLWAKRVWIEKVLSGQTARESLSHFTYRYLDAHSQDPTDGIFKHELLQSSLRAVRTGYRQAQDPPSLFGFEKLGLK